MKSKFILCTPFLVTLIVLFVIEINRIDKKERGLAPENGAFYIQTKVVHQDGSNFFLVYCEFKKDGTVEWKWRK